MAKTRRRRRWLNPRQHEDSGFLLSRVTEDPEWGHDILFTVADCTRRVEIDLSFSTERERKQRIKKVDVMIEELEHLRAEIVRLPEVKKRR